MDWEVSEGEGGRIGSDKGGSWRITGVVARGALDRELELGWRTRGVRVTGKTGAAGGASESLERVFIGRLKRDKEKLGEMEKIFHNI
jgi:hypothetical protein